MILHPIRCQGHNGATHRKNIDTPSLVGNYPVAPATQELLVDGVEDTQNAVTRELPRFARKGGGHGTSFE
jgi:hypothetical protein